VPFIAPLTGADGLREPFNKLVFHVRASYMDETELIVKQLTELGLKKIAVFHQNDAYGQAGLVGVQRALARRKLTPTAVATVERNSTDVGLAVKTLAAAQPEAIVQISAYKSCAAFIRAARKAGYGGLFYNVSFVGTQALADELGKDAAGVVVSQVMPSPFGAAVGLVDDYQHALKKLDPKAEPNYTSIEGYIAARVVVDALKRMGRPTREALVGALETLPAYESRGYQLRFGPSRHVGSSFVELSMLTADGRSAADRPAALSRPSSEPPLAAATAGFLWRRARRTRPGGAAARPRRHPLLSRGTPLRRPCMAPPQSLECKCR
jgi:ABC-type branched-subunit amino acid transport system substrate-binding protein